MHLVIHTVHGDVEWLGRERKKNALISLSKDFLFNVNGRELTLFISALLTANVDFEVQFTTLECGLDIVISIELPN